jgi:hypothetical protein
MLGTAACGGGNNSPTGPSAQPFNQTVSGQVAVFGTTRHDVTASRGGTMTLRLSWAGSTDLDLFLSNPVCASLYPKSACGIMAAADGVVNPEVITRSVNEGETFRAWVDNLSLTQSMNYTLSINIQ